MLHIDAKRLSDVLISAVLLLAALPLILVLAVVSAVSLRTWPFFVQERIGLGGKAFRFVKIRTLPSTFATYAAKSALDDIRIPVPMRLLRATHLDELPQLWLVLTGRMSLVGPRPEMAMLHERLTPEAAVERVSVRPGVTGLWQVSAHSDGLICDRVEYDRLYVRYSNVLLDAWIMLKTAQKMLLGRRIHLFDVPLWAIGPERSLTPVPSNVIILEPAASKSMAGMSLLGDRMPIAVGAD